MALPVFTAAYGFQSNVGLESLAEVTCGQMGHGVTITNCDEERDELTFVNQSHYSLEVPRGF